METGHAKKERRRPAPCHRRPAGSARPAILLPVVGAAPSRPGAERAGRAANFDKIPINSINLDKFTWFFDKFLKSGYPISIYNSVSCFQLSGENSLGQIHMHEAGLIDESDVVFRVLVEIRGEYVGSNR